MEAKPCHFWLHKILNQTTVPIREAILQFKGFGVHMERHQILLRAGSDYGQTLRGEAFGPMKMHKCPKSVLSAFTLEAEVQRTLPPKEPRWQHFPKVMAPRIRPLKQSLGRAKCLTQTSVKRPNFFFFKYSKSDIGLF